jgi:hypothetical protein
MVLPIMRYIGIIILLVLYLNLLLFTSCPINTVKPEPTSGNLENQEDISSNNSQGSSTYPIEDPATIYPQQWATGTRTVGDPWANDCIKKAYTACPVVLIHWRSFWVHK